MRDIFFSILSIFFFSVAGLAQKINVRCKIIDAETKQILPGSSIMFNSTLQVANDSGIVSYASSIGDTLTLVISHSGYTNDSTIIIASDSLFVFELVPSAVETGEEEEEEVLVTATRTNSRIEDLPTRVEVLGQEEMREENGIKPGNIASILGDFSGIQIQQTNAATSNADMRIQGLPGKYTQLLRDGLPLYAGFSGSFSILQIPPLDLQQVELIKGSSSTLYGGGAIAGMVNLVSKKPKLKAPERIFTINHSTLNENNLNGFFSGRNEKIGYTFFAGGTYQQTRDVNTDGFSDVAGVKSAFVHPRLFFYTGKSSSLVVGYSFNYEDRIGGDMQVLKEGKSGDHQFFIQNKSLRNTADLDWERKLKNDAVLVAKGSASFYNRDVSTNVFGMKALQTLWYTELHYAKKWKSHNWVFGINYTGDQFKKHLPDSSHITDQSSYTVGAFLQDNWQLFSRLTMQYGLRADRFQRSAENNVFVLPALSFMYKWNSRITTRLGGGLGYKTPTIFSAEIDERDYKFLADLPQGIQPEKSGGANADINIKAKAGDWHFTFNQAFYYTRIIQPLLYDSSSSLIVLKNASDVLQTAGAETYFMAKKEALELYLGYTYTHALRKYSPAAPNVPLTARHKAAALVAYEFSHHFRTGLESSYIGKQFLENGSKTSGYLMLALMVRYDIGLFSFVLNGENLLDYRISKQQQVVFPPYNNPSFPELWAPLDGRVINLSVQIKL